MAKGRKKPLDHHHEWEIADSDRLIQDMERATNLLKGRSGNPSQNLDDMGEQYRQAIRERGINRMAMNTYGSVQSNPAYQMNVPATYIPQQTFEQQFAMIQDQNTERLFKPLIPMNRYVHPDDHLEWLKGRTRSVCSRVKWSKTAQSY